MLLVSGRRRGERDRVGGRGRGRKNERRNGGGSTMFSSGRERRGRSWIGWRVVDAAGLIGENSSVEDGERSSSEPSASVGVLGVGESWRSEGSDGDGLFGGRRRRVGDENEVLWDGLSSKEGRRSS